jgi:hypothetical protein
LIIERDEALAKNEMDKVATAEAEMDRVGVVLATVQFAINQQQAINMNAVAARLLESVQAQRAIGLSTAAQSIEGRCLEHRPSAFSPSDSKATRRVISREHEHALCPIHTTACVKLGSAAPRRLTGIAEMQTGRAPMEGARPG